MSQEDRQKSIGWRNLAESSIWTLLSSGIATMVFVIEGIDPALAATLFAFLIGLGLTTRDRRSGPVVLLVATIIFLVPAVFFAIQVFQVPESTVNFILNSVLIVAGVTTLIASIALVRKRALTVPPRYIAIGAAALVLALTFVALVIRIGYEEPASGAGDLRIMADDNEFTPDRARARAGRVSVVVTNADLSLHTFSIDELDVDQELPGGVRSAVTFDVEPGTYEYYCAIPGHEEMKGTLSVR
jgi:plastocyanin